MIDPYAPPTASLIPDPVSRVFFVVSKFKFALMYVLTCGFYLTYWLYMSWKLLASVLGLLILIVETYCFMQVQDAINHAENDVDGLGNASLTWANGAWIGLGLCIWAFAFIAYYAIFTNAV